MKIQLLLSTLVGITFAANCRDGYWGATCNNVCGGGCKPVTGVSIGTCGKDDGMCDDTTGCEDDWKGDKCDTPVCFGSQGCSYGGSCVAPNYCVCGKVGAQVVGKKKEVNGVDGIDCVSLRRDGIIGSGIALCVILFSITTCGLIAEKKGKPK